MNKEEKIEMVGECTSSYRIEEFGDDGICIQIYVPRRFADLWLVKLTELRTTDTEIAEYNDCSDESEIQ